MLDQLLTSESVLRRSYAFERFGVPAAVLDNDGMIVETNEAWRLFAVLNAAHPDATGVGVGYLDVCDRAFASGDEAAGKVGVGLRSILRGDRSSFELEYPCPSPIEDRWFLLHAASAPVNAGAGVVLFHVNITARKLLEARVEAGEGRDPWTGLPDRRAAVRLIESSLTRAAHSGKRVTVITIRVDGLGAVDDELGLPVSEELMVQVTARALRVLRADDELCRLGGDQVVVLCSDLDERSVAAIVRRLDDAIATPVQAGASEFTLDFAIAVASGEPGSSAIALLGEALVPESEAIRADRRTQRRTRALGPSPEIRSSIPTDGNAGDDARLTVARAQRDAVLAHSGDVVLYFEPDATIAWASPAIRDLAGIEPESLVGRNSLEMIHPDDRDRALAELGTLGGLGDHVRTELRLVGDDGTVYWVEETVTNLVDDPNIGYIVGNLRDITERKRQEQAQAQLSAIVTTSTAAIVSTTLDGTVQTWNEAADRLFGYAADAMIGRNIAVIAPAEAFAALREQIEDALEGGYPTDAFESVGRHRDGSEFDTSVSISPIHDAHGEITGMSGVIRDITEQVELRRNVEIDRRRLADAQHLAHLGSFELDDVAGTMTWSAELEAILGVSSEVAPSIDAFRARVHPEDRARVENMLREANLGQSDRECTHRVVRPDGAVRWVAARVRLSNDARSPGLVGTLLDVTDRKQLEFDLLERDTHDALTGLPNRILLVEQLEVALAANDLGGVGVLVLGVDRFKAINDSLGHDRGDALLVAIASTVRGALEPGQTAARFGGDTFAVVCPGLVSPKQALDICDRVRAMLAVGLVVELERYQPTVSVGIVVAGIGDAAIATLRDAEIAMYRAKDQGRDRAMWFDPSLHQAVVADFELERELRDAIARDELSLVFQPVLDLETGDITGCEALVRWQHPRRGTLNPDEFIPIAETTGLILSLGRWVLTRALETAARWPEAVHVAVNLSAFELVESDLTEFVAKALLESDVSASRLVLEITETAVVRDPDSASRAISALRALGVRIIIDDFGTGYTSLAFLRDYRLDGLKIDRSYVTGLDRGSTAIVDAMIRMSAALGLEVIAEGIETDAELEKLRALGCRFIQGYVVSRPVPAEELVFARTEQGTSGSPTLDVTDS